MEKGCNTDAKEVQTTAVQTEKEKKKPAQVQAKKTTGVQTTQKVFKPIPGQEKGLPVLDKYQRVVSLYEDDECNPKWGGSCGPEGHSPEHSAWAIAELTKEVAMADPETINELFDPLAQLQESIVLARHFVRSVGIGEGAYTKTEGNMISPDESFMGANAYLLELVVDTLEGKEHYDGLAEAQYEWSTFRGTSEEVYCPTPQKRAQIDQLTYRMLQGDPDDYLLLADLRFFSSCSMAQRLRIIHNDSRIAVDYFMMGPMTVYDKVPYEGLHDLGTTWPRWIYAERTYSHLAVQRRIDTCESVKNNLG